MRPEQTVEEMAEEVLVRQAEALVDRTGLPFETSLESVAQTEAGRQLRELANSSYSEERAATWQLSLPWQRAEERHFSLLESYMEWSEDKEACTEYHAVLEELASLRG